MKRSLLIACGPIACVLACFAQDLVFRSGTRLVEVDVVVRDKHGPVTGLTKDDFSLFDCKGLQRAQPPNMNQILDCRDKRQSIEVFREVNVASLTAAPPLALPAGAVSNRLYYGDEPANNATVILMDEVNTPFELKGYERAKMADFLKSAAQKNLIGKNNRVALYVLGRGLHIVQDFTSDPQKLLQALAKLDSGDLDKPKSDAGSSKPPPGQIAGRGEAEIAAVEAQVFQDLKNDASLDAIQVIIDHTRGVPGRKNLVWVAAQLNGLFNPLLGPPKARLALGQANIAVYPVLVRGLQASGILEIGRGRGPMRLPMNDLQIQYNNRLLAETVGGTGFSDAADLPEALRAADDDSKSYYVLGFYPSEAELDGGTHEVTIDIAKSALSKRVDKSSFNVNYRRVYLAMKPGAQGDAPKLTITDYFRNPLNALGIGVGAKVSPDAARQGALQLDLYVGLSDVQLQHQNGHYVGSLQVATRLEASDNGTRLVTQPMMQTVAIDLTDAELQAKRTTGMRIIQPLPIVSRSGSVHVIVQDSSSGAVGSVSVPLPDPR